MRQPSKGSTSFAPYFVLLRNPYFLSLFFPLTPIPLPPFPPLAVFVSLFLSRRRVSFSLADLAFRRRPFPFFLASASRTRYGKRANSSFVYPASDNNRVSATVCLLLFSSRSPYERDSCSPFALFHRHRAAYRDERTLTTVYGARSEHGTRQTRRLRQREDTRTFGPEASALPGVLAQANCRHRTSSPANFIHSTSNETANYPITAARPTAFHRHH